ncbi:hypothetical protein LSH36_17g07031 [Paralvinella palmiformis]|uniref:Uncharacterized protein n=1 Tax=Paralvinella palmiformis TaxID=53620 RepID=A0AAD9NFR1_9ANNE|nr:hypothetical protein LSH36_17g07031 [Paralvinella palmiformis]
MRLSSHHLRIEMGRWSRIPREKRTFHCRTDTQTEEHVLLRCNISGPLRHQMNINVQTLQDLFSHFQVVITIICNTPLFVLYGLLLFDYNLYRTLMMI